MFLACQITLSCEWLKVTWLGKKILIKQPFQSIYNPILIADFHYLSEAWRELSEVGRDSREFNGHINYSPSQ